MADWAWTDFSELDRKVEWCRVHGVTPKIVLTYAPSWAEPLSSRRTETAP